MAVIQLVAGYPVLGQWETDYRERALAHFTPHSDHPAVVRFDSLSRVGLSFDRVPKVFAALGPLPHLALPEQIHQDVRGRGVGRGEVGRWAAELRDFYAVTNFEAFFRDNSDHFRWLVQGALPTVTDAVALLGEYSGEGVDDVAVVLSPLLHDGGFGMRGGDTEFMAFIGPDGVEEGNPSFGDRDRLGRLVWHELAHGFVNPATARHHADVAATEVVDSVFRSRMRAQAYPDWPTIVNESVIRAIEVRLAYATSGTDGATSVAAEQVGRGFCHVPAIAAALERYEGSRDVYPLLSSFFPELIEVFRRPLPTCS